LETLAKFGFWRGDPIPRESGGEIHCHAEPGRPDRLGRPARSASALAKLRPLLALSKQETASLSCHLISFPFPGARTQCVILRHWLLRRLRCGPFLTCPGSRGPVLYPGMITGHPCFNYFPTPGITRLGGVHSRRLRDAQWYESSAWARHYLCGGDQFNEQDCRALSRYGSGQVWSMSKLAAGIPGRAHYS